MCASKVLYPELPNSEVSLHRCEMLQPTRSWNGKWWMHGDLRTCPSGLSAKFPSHNFSPFERPPIHQDSLLVTGSGTSLAFRNPGLWGKWDRASTQRKDSWQPPSILHKTSKGPHIAWHLEGDTPSWRCDTAARETHHQTQRGSFWNCRCFQTQLN